MRAPRAPAQGPDGLPQTAVKTERRHDKLESPATSDAYGHLVFASEARNSDVRVSLCNGAEPPGAGSADPCGGSQLSPGCRRRLQRPALRARGQGHLGEGAPAPPAGAALRYSADHRRRRRQWGKPKPTRLPTQTGRLQSTRTWTNQRTRNSTCCSRAQNPAGCSSCPVPQN